MYRRYEDPHAVREMLESAERELRESKERGDDVEAQIDLLNEVESLRERLNFAWQDDEYDEMEGM